MLEELDKCDYIDKSTKLYTEDEVIAMLTELQLEIEELKKEPAHCHHFERDIRFSSNIIQQKINSLKENKGNE